MTDFTATAYQGGLDGTKKKRKEGKEIEKREEIILG